MNIFSYIILFMIYAVLGWIVEVIAKLVTLKRFINRGFLIGPYCPIYGVGALSVTFLLKDYLSHPIGLFIMSIAVCAVVEYSGSYILEKIFNTRWWDYTNYRFNINGRICLENLIPFGFGCILVMYVLNPYFTELLMMIPKNISIVIAIILLVLFMIDFVISFEIIWKFKKISRNTRKDNTEKVTKYVRKQILHKNKKLYTRIINAFPKFEVAKILKKKKGNKNKRKIKNKK